MRQPFVQMGNNSLFRYFVTRCREDRSTIDTDTHTLGNLDDEFRFLDVTYHAVETSRGNDTITCGEGFTLPLYFLLTLLLWANDEELEDQYDCSHHDDGGPSTTLLSLCLEKDCFH